MTRTDANSYVPITSSFGGLLALCLMALLGVRIAALGFADTDLFFDEAQYWSWSLNPDFGYFSKPPLIAWIIAGMTSVCGHGEFCVRLASPLLHTAAAIAIYFAGTSLFDRRTGFWAAIVFATLPGVSFSAGIVSTDVPLLCLWSLALLAWIKLLETRAWTWALLLGAAIGLGLMAKYAMVYFIGCALVYLALSPRSRWILGAPQGAAVIGITALIVLPNILWNLDNGWITFGHTADNAKWGGELIKPLKLLEFLGAQFGVFGPILMACLIAIGIGAWRQGATDQDRLLLSFSLPVIGVIALQALLSRAHANWAATAYPAAAILVTATLLQKDYRRLFAASLALHLAVVLILAISAGLASQISFPGRLDPFSRVLGWQRTADAVGQAIEENEIATLLTEDRLVTAEMLYYLRENNVTIRSWRPGERPRDHFEFTRAFSDEAGEPVLLVSLRENTRYVSDHFARAERLGERRVPAGPKSTRTVYLTVLTGFKGQ